MEITSTESYPRGAVARSAAEYQRIERLLHRIQRKQRQQRSLTEFEHQVAETLQRMVTAEARARDGFYAFYSDLNSPAASGAAGNGAAGSGGDSVSLPGDVAALVSDWVEARRAWDDLMAEFLAQTPLPALPQRAQRPGVLPPAALPIPTALIARDAFAALFAPQLWKPQADGQAIQAQVRETAVRIECDEGLGFRPEQAIQQIARHGASAAQTFLALAAFWQEQMGPAKPEAYLTAYASDLLRFQGRKQTPRGGYHRADLIAKGRDIYLLSRISVPQATVTVLADGGERQRRTVSVTRLLSLERLDAEDETDQDGAQVSHSLIRFRYHLGSDVHAWFCGEQRQFTTVSPQLIRYHPVRQKYQILLGFCLAYYDRVNRRSPQETRRINLPALLSLSAIPLPERRLTAFLECIEEALRDLARDGVVPGVHLEKPAGWPEMLAARRARAVIENSVVVFPRLLCGALPTAQKRVTS